MEENYIVAASKVGPAPTHRSALRLVAVCAVVAGAALSIAAWWDTDSGSDQDVLRRDSYATSGTSAVRPKATMDAPVRAGSPAPGGESQSVLQPAGSNSGVMAPRLEPPPRDLIDAIRRAQAASGNQPLPSATEQSSRQARRPMSPEEAAKAFGEAVKALRNQQPYTSAVSPFGPVKN